MKPMIILAPGLMSEGNIKLLRENDICVVVAKDPAKVRFVDPIPAVSSRTKIEHAAIQLSRKLLQGIHPQYGQSWTSDTKAAIAQLYVNLLIEGTPLDPNPTQEEREKREYDREKIAEMGRLAREDAKAERAAAKARAAEQPKQEPKA